MDKKILMMMVVCVFLLSMVDVSAFVHKDTIDGNYFGDYKYDKVILQNRVWYDPFGWVIEDTILETEIVKHTVECLFYCETEGYTAIYENSTALFDLIDFKDEKSKAKTINYKIYIRQNKTISWSEDTYDQDNKTVKVSHEDTYEDWVEYKLGEKKAIGNYTWKIVGQKDAKESIDWIPTIDGEKINEWAWWDALSGDYEVFTTNGSFTVPAGVFNVSVLIVGGGGGGGSGSGNDGAGGGGAGGLIFNHSYPVTPSASIPVTVGVGGLGQTGNGYGFRGGNSSFGSGTLLLTAGGGGAGVGNLTILDKMNGSSGGGGYGDTADTKGGKALYLSQGQNGGNGGQGTATNRAGGGGGGYSQVGEAGNTDSGGYGGDGGNGTQYYNTWFSGGGGGGGTRTSGNAPRGSGGWMSGGQGGDGDDPAEDGVNQTGGGGGGAGLIATAGGDGSWGVVLVRYSAPSLDIYQFNPTESQALTITPVTFSFNVTNQDPSTFSIFNVTLVVNDTYEFSNNSGFATNYTWSLNLPDGSHNWTVDVFDNLTQLYEGVLTSFTLDSNSPIVTTANNLTNLVRETLPVNSTWNYTAYDDSLDSCYYNTTDAPTYKVVTCNASIQTQWNNQGIKTIQYCANDTGGLETCNQKSISIFSVVYSQADNPDPISEGFNATFNLTLNLSSIPTTTATLILNNTIYNPTTTIAGVNGYYFEYGLTIPSNFGNATGNFVDWFWNYSIDGVVTNESTATTNITVYGLEVDNCSAFGELILNLSLRDEEGNTLVNESAGANVEIDLNISSLDDPSTFLQYSNTWTNENNPQVCVPINLINNSQFSINFTIGFESTDRVWEFFYLDSGILNATKQYNSLTGVNVNLMDLNTTDSTSFLFNYFDQDGLPVDNAIVHVFRKYIGSGIFREVERSKADQNGDTIVHLVEEDVIYYFLVTQNGESIFTSSTYTALCQATPCLIQLEASGGFVEFPTDWDLINGGGYSIQSSPITRQVNLTYLLNESATMNLTVYRYLSDGSYEPLNTSVQTASSGSIVITVPQTAGNVSFFASVTKDGDFINSEWVDFEGKAQDRFGVTLAIFLSALIILSLGLMAVTEGVGTIIAVIFGVAISGFLGLITTELSTGVNIIIYLILAGGILLWKLTGGRK